MNRTTLSFMAAVSLVGTAVADPYLEEIKPLLERYCVECHGGEKVKGDVDFTLIQKGDDADAHFETWETVVELLRENEMPPEEKDQPTLEEKQRIYDWYQHRFVDTVEAHPGYFRPRRLSAAEYRNTLASLFGFDLEVNIREAEQTVVEKSLVMKLLPTDPPGASGFKNDTAANPLTSLIWSQYSYLVDSALDRIFSPEHRADLERYSGKLEGGKLTAPRARRLVRNFAARSYRRPVKADWTENLFAQNPGGEELVQAVKGELKTLLMSPGFLYRGLLMPKEQGKQQRVDDYELAERLSYFLWGDMPDQILTDLARDGRLSDAEVLEQQTNRLLQSPKSRHLVDDFAWQWFALGDMEQASSQVPHVVALRSQVLDFFHYLLVEDRPLLELVDSEVSFVSPLIAKFYPKDRKQLKTYRKQRGIEMEIVPSQRIQLRNTPERGGVLSMPGILAMNRGPVLRGIWMLERILGEHLPEPPPDVGQVPPNRTGETLSFRERFEAHRSQASCAVCHDKIDPLGFATQGYDDRGNFILQAGRGNEEGMPVDKNGTPIDTSGRMPNGEVFAGFDDLKTILKTSYRRQIIKNIVERTLSYALCRKLELYDRPTVERMVDRLDSEHGSYGELIRLIVNSLPFQETFVKGESS